MQSRPFRVRNKLVSRQKMSKIEVQVFSSGPETKTFRLYVRITTRKFIVSFDLTSVWVAKIYLLACFQRECTLWLLVRVLTWRARWGREGSTSWLSAWWSRGVADGHLCGYRADRSYWVCLMCEPASHASQSASHESHRFNVWNGQVMDIIV